MRFERVVRALEWLVRAGTVASLFFYFLGLINLYDLVNIITVVVTVILILVAYYSRHFVKKTVKRILSAKVFIIRDIYGRMGSIIEDRRCKICTHEKRVDIERALLSGAKYEDVAKQYNVSIATISRHFQKHMPRLILDEGELNKLYEEHMVKQFDLAQELYKLVMRLEDLYNKLSKLDEKFFSEKSKVSAHAYVESIAERRNILADIRETLTQISELSNEIKTERDLSELLQRLKNLSK